MSETPAAPVPAEAPKPATALVVPDYLKTMGGGSAAVDSIATAAMSIPRVSMRGKKFRFMEGGEEVLAVNDRVRLIIFGVEPQANHFIKTYYKDAYAGAGANSPPDCSSDDGVTPSGWVQNPQHKNCAECPKNRFGSATSRQGKPSKACRDSKRLWVGREEEVLKSGVAKAVLYAMGVPVTSLKSLAEFGREMKSLNVPISAAIIEVIMDDDSEFPQISFQCVGFLSEENAKACMARGEKAEWRLGQVSRAAISAPVPNVALPGATAAAGEPAPAAAPASTGATVPATGAKMDEIVKNW